MTRGAARESGGDSRPGGLSTRRKLLFGVLTLVAFFGILEVAARLAAPLFLEDPFETSTVRSVWAEQGWTIDPVLGWTLIASDSYVRGGAMCITNSHGLRGPEFRIEKEPGTLRVLAIGDSTVMGFGVEQDEVFSHLLQEQLASRLEQRVEVINAGVPGYSSEQTRLYLETRGMALAPDIVIFESNYNDRRAIAPGGEPDSAEAFHSLSRRLAVFELVNYSALAQLVRRAISTADLTMIRSGSYDFSEIPVDSPPRVPLERYEENVREIVATARRGGAKVVLVALSDHPGLVGGIRRASELADAGKLWEAEKELLGPLFKPMQKLLAQQTLNRILERAGRSDEIRLTVPAGLPSKSTGGYTPVSLSDPYVAVLHEIGRELDVPVVEPRAPDGVSPGEIYIDQIHLNARGHEILAAELARVLPSR